MPLRPDEWVVAGLPNVAKIFCIEEKPDPAESPFSKKAENQIRHARGAVGIILEPLASRVEQFDPKTAACLVLPRSDESCGVFRRERHCAALVVVFVYFRGLGKSVSQDQPIVASAKTCQEFCAGCACRAARIHDFHRRLQKQKMS